MIAPEEKAALLELADRCEREEPSVDLEQAIFRAVKGVDIVVKVNLPDYTTSLDAAVTLVPEGATIAVQQFSDLFEACVTIASGRFLVSEDVERYGRAKTEPMARVAAALRARASLSPSPAYPREEGR